MAGWQTSQERRRPVWPLPHASGRFYASPLVMGSNTTFAISANVLYACPILIPELKTYTAIALEVTTLAGGASARMGIYRDNGGVPGALILDAGTVSVATTGLKSITISQALDPGWYWLAVVSDGAPTLRAIEQNNCQWQLGFSSGTDITPHPGWSVAFTYAALPDPFTGGGALITTDAPRVLLGL